MVEHYCCF